MAFAPRHVLEECDDLTDLDQRLDALYREPPEGFVGARNELTKALRAEGEKAAAAEVKKLRRPSPAAWLVNRVSADDPQAVRDLADASDELAEAQRRLLEEGGDPKDLRMAAAHERELLDGLVAEAREVASARGAASEAVIDKVTQTLRAIGLDPELREAALRGRVEKERSVATVGGTASLSLGTRPAPKRTRRSQKNQKTEQREAERARTELARLRERLEVAETRREMAESGVRAAEKGLGSAKAELTEARGEIRDLKREIGSAEKRLA